MSETIECPECESEFPEHLAEIGKLCPRCSEKQRIEEMRRHQMTRDRTMEPW